MATKVGDKQSGKDAQRRLGANKKGITGEVGPEKGKGPGGVRISLGE